MYFFHVAAATFAIQSQARALTPQLAEPNEIRFFIATQSLKPNNQLHLIELNADASSLATRTKIFAHPLGEVWKLNSSPYNSRQLVSCYSTQKGSQVVMQSAILTLPPDALETDATNKEYMSFESVEILDTEVCTLRIYCVLCVKMYNFFYSLTVTKLKQLNFIRPTNSCWPPWSMAKCCCKNGHRHKRESLPK